MGKTTHTPLPRFEVFGEIRYDENYFGEDLPRTLWHVLKIQDGEEANEITVLVDSTPTDQEGRGELPEAIKTALAYHDRLVRALYLADAVLGQICENPAEAANVALQGYTGHARESTRTILAEIGSAK